MTAFHSETAFRSTAQRPYMLADWQAGVPPPKGWDVADAIEDGWSRAEVTAMMKAAVCEALPDWPDDKGNEMERGDTLREAAQRWGDEQVAPTPSPIPHRSKQPAKRFPADVVRDLPALPSLARGSEVEVARSVCGMLNEALGEVVMAEGSLWAWHETEWSSIPDQAVRLAAHRYDGAIINGKSELKVGRSFINGVVSEVGTILGHPDFFSGQVQKLNALNTVVSIDDLGRVTNEPHDPSHRFRHTIKAEFTLNTDLTPPEGSMLRTLLDGAFLGDADADDKVALIGEILGSAAFGLATQLPLPKAFVFLGETASNGKSTIAGLLSCLLPDGAVCSIPPSGFEDEKRIVGLAGKAANVADELAANAIAGETFKSAVTGNPISGRALYRDAITFAPRAIHVFTSNVLPRFSGGLDKGLQRRLVVVRFNRTIPESEIVADILDRIRRDELELLLGYAIGGARRLFQRRAYTLPPSSSEALRDWLRMDPVNEWFEVRVEPIAEAPPGGWLKTSELYADFKSWSVQQGYTEKFLPAVNSFGMRLRVLPGVNLHRGAGGTMVQGVGLKSSGWKAGDW